MGQGVSMHELSVIEVRIVWCPRTSDMGLRIITRPDLVNSQGTKYLHIIYGKKCQIGLDIMVDPVPCPLAISLLEFVSRFVIFRSHQKRLSAMPGDIDRLLRMTF
jgi:hypothetical protein